MILLALLGCAREEYDVADLQLDVEAPVPDGAETLRLCVSDHGALDRGAGNGRMAFPGIRVGASLAVSLDIYDLDGVLLASAGPAVLDDATRYATTPLLPPAAPCEAGGALAAAGDDAWLLALRFEEP